MKHFTDQEIQDVINKAPKFIKDELSSGEDTAAIIVQIGQKYKLHIDQIGVLAELNRNMLLGLVGPEEFLKELIAMGISDKDAREIMTEINQKIFVPLREKMRGAGVNTEPPAKPTPPPAKPAAWGASVPPVPRPPQINASVPSYAPRPSVASQSAGVVGPPLQSPKYFHLENKIPPFIKVISEIKPSHPTSPKATQGTAIIPIHSLKAAEGTARFVALPSDGSQTSLMRKLLEDHEEPNINLDKSSVPINLPGAMPLITVPEVVVPKVELPIIPKTPVAPPIKPSSSDDPYREPIDTP